jgi:serine/threonine-protein kinase SRPK3
VSEIKCPKDMDDEGIVSELEDLRFKNYNPISKYDSRNQRSAEEDSESSSSDSSDDDNDVEEIEDYHVDGYHAAHVGEIIDSKYILLKKLGWGHFSTVWLVFKLSDKQLYALKI